MSENSDQAFLFRQAVFDDVVADEKRLHGRFWNVGHVSILRVTSGKGHTVLVFRGNDGRSAGILGRRGTHGPAQNPLNLR